MLNKHLLLLKNNTNLSCRIIYYDYYCYFCFKSCEKNIYNVIKRYFGVSGSWGYSIFAREGNRDSNVKKQNLHKFEHKGKPYDFLKIKNLHCTKWPGNVSKLGASYFFNKKWNTGFYHMLIEEEKQNKPRELDKEKDIDSIKKDIVLLSSCNRHQVENKKIENQMKDLTCGYSVQIILSGKGAKCYYEDVPYSPVTNNYKNDIKQYYYFKNGSNKIKKIEDSSEKSTENSNKINIENTENTKEIKKTKKIKKLFVRLGIGTKNIDITRVLTMHKKYVNIDVDKTGTIITVYGYNKKYVGSVSHRLYKIVKMNVYTMKGGYVYLHKPKQKIPKKK